MRFDSEMMPTRMVRKPFPVRVHDGAVSVDAAAHSIFSKKAVSMLNHVEAALMQHPATWTRTSHDPRDTAASAGGGTGDRPPPAARAARPRADRAGARRVPQHERGRGHPRAGAVGAGCHENALDCGHFVAALDQCVTPLLGKRTVNTEPLPASLVTVTSPPIMRASLRVMARPSPVPPKFCAGSMNSLLVDKV